MDTKLHKTLLDKLNTEDSRVKNKFQVYIWIGSYMSLSYAHKMTKKVHLKMVWVILILKEILVNSFFICVIEMAKNRKFKCLRQQYQLQGQKYPTCCLHLKGISSTYTSEIKKYVFKWLKHVIWMNYISTHYDKEIWTVTPFYIIFYITFNFS